MVLKQKEMLIGRSGNNYILYAYLYTKTYACRTQTAEKVARIEIHCRLSLFMMIMLLIELPSFAWLLKFHGCKPKKSINVDKTRLEPPITATGENVCETGRVCFLETYLELILQKDSNRDDCTSSFFSRSSTLRFLYLKINTIFRK